MKKILISALAFTALSGCMTARWVTAKTWVGNDTLYVAYTEWNRVFLAQSYEAKLLRCNRTPDNVLACQAEEQVNALLNDGNSQK